MAAQTPNQESSRSSRRATHILFVGAGAVGCFYASRLHHPSHDVYVSLTARSNYAAIASSGVALKTRTFGDYTFHPHAVFPSVAAATPLTTTEKQEDGSFSTSSSSPDVTAAAATADKQQNQKSRPPVEGWDYIIVTTKALPDVTDDAALIAPLVTSPHTCIVLIQNGVGVEAPYRERFPRNPIVSAVTVVSAEQVSQGVIRQNRWTRISLGPYGSFGMSKGKNKTAESEPYDVVRRGTESMCQLAKWWGEGLGGIRDVETHTEQELQTIRWHKLCINAAFNPTAVLSGGRGNADQLTDPELRRHIRGVMDEIWDATPKVLGLGGGGSGSGSGSGGFFPSSLATPERIMASNERNGGAKPSMLLDWEAGRPMELEVILGNPVRIAREAGVEMPKLQTLYALLRSMQKTRDEAKARGKEKGKL
ncbi:2-dehydropantoate 2-reductase [Xylariaceae sp. FL0594]|nr:2-dehydropantoate 2-reductase [Xylariaceae sp. FL0594]